MAPFPHRRRPRGRPRHPDVLTPAEWRVLEHLREGRSNAEIADRLGVSINTVRTQVSSMLAKLHLADRQALAAWRGEPAEATRRRLALPLALPGWLRERVGASLVGKVAIAGAVAALSLGGFAALSALDGRSDAPALAPTATQGPTEPDSSATPAADTSPSIAPGGRTPYSGLNDVIEALLTTDAAGLEQRFATVEAREYDEESGADQVWTASEWTARLASAERSLYAVTIGHPQAWPHREFDIVLASEVDGRVEGWRFAVDGDRVVEVVILDRPSTVSVSGAFERFLVLPPPDELPQPPGGYEFSRAPATGDAGVDTLVGLIAADDQPGLQASVAYSDGTVPVQQCGGGWERRDATYVEQWLRTLGEQAHSLHAVARVPDGHVPAADHLVVVVRETGPYDWEPAGLLETGGRIVGLLTGCAPYPPRAYLVPPPGDGAAAPDPTRRSAHAALDAVLDALAARDAAALVDLIDFAEVACVTEQTGIGAPPLCRDGEPEGTPVEVIGVAGCEGGYVRRDQLDDLLDYLLDAEWALYAAVDMGEPTPGRSGAFSRGDTWTVLAPLAPDPQRGAVVLNITERGIGSIWTGCGMESPDALLARIGAIADYLPDFLLAPPAAGSP